MKRGKKERRKGGRQGRETDLDNPRELVEAEQDLFDERLVARREKLEQRQCSGEADP
jgi:hypothetical protein